MNTNSSKMISLYDRMKIITPPGFKLAHKNVSVNQEINAYAILVLLFNLIQFTKQGL